VEQVVTEVGTVAVTQQSPDASRPSTTRAGTAAGGGHDPGGARRSSADRVIWDLDARDAQPPWRDDIAADITNLGNVTMDGKDMFDVIEEALDYAEGTKQAATLKSVGPVGPGPEARS
jgi:hypothetical protein